MQIWQHCHSLDGHPDPQLKFSICSDDHLKPNINEFISRGRMPCITILTQCNARCNCNIRENTVALPYFHSDVIRWVMLQIVWLSTSISKRVMRSTRLMTTRGKLAMTLRASKAGFDTDKMASTARAIITTHSMHCSHCSAHTAQCSFNTLLTPRKSYPLHLQLHIMSAHTKRFVFKYFQPPLHQARP